MLQACVPRLLEHAFLVGLKLIVISETIPKERSRKRRCSPDHRIDHMVFAFEISVAPLGWPLHSHCGRWTLAKLERRVEIKRPVGNFTESFLRGKVYQEIEQRFERMRPACAFGETKKIHDRSLAGPFRTISVWSGACFRAS
ncbi:hypothetical protein AOQ73_40720 [Bradyrhizobium pachyrhizi]|nr:hypothetical protein AOQ73_40720 [Bradyrhizobium pachyrhizi]